MHDLLLCLGKEDVKECWKDVAELPEGIRFIRDGKKILITKDAEFEVKCDLEWPDVPSYVMTINGSVRP